MECEHTFKLIRSNCHTSVGKQEFYECFKCGLLKLVMPNAD